MGGQWGVVMHPETGEKQWEAPREAIMGRHARRRLRSFCRSLGQIADSPFDAASARHAEQVAALSALLEDRDATGWRTWQWFSTRSSRPCRQSSAPSAPNSYSTTGERITPPPRSKPAPTDRQRDSATTAAPSTDPLYELAQKKPRLRVRRGYVHPTFYALQELFSVQKENGLLHPTPRPGYLIP